MSLNLTYIDETGEPQSLVKFTNINCGTWLRVIQKDLMSSLDEAANLLEETRTSYDGFLLDCDMMGCTPLSEKDRHIEQKEEAFQAHREQETLLILWTRFMEDDCISLKALVSTVAGFIPQGWHEPRWSAYNRQILKRGIDGLCNTGDVDTYLA